MTRTYLSTLAVAALVLLLPACALRKGPPDPAKVQQRMTATLDGEKAMIQSMIADAERAESLIGLLAERDRLVAEHGELVQAYRKQMADLNADYNAERQDFEQAIAAYNTEREASQREQAELIEAMKHEATAEEWKAVAKYQVKKLNPRDLAHDAAGGGN